MDFIQQLNLWAKGDAFQGKIMLGAGIVLVIALWLIIKNDNPVAKGMLIPIVLLVVVNLGYGGFLTFARPAHIVSTTEMHKQNPQEVYQQEIAKSEKDHKIYSMVKPIWAVLIVVCLALFFFVPSEYVKGLSLGLIGLFFSLMLIDTMLHRRLEPYLEVLQGLIQS